MSNLFEKSLDNDTSIALQSYGPGVEVQLITADDIFFIRGLFENAQQDINPSGASAPVVLTVPTLHVQKSLIDSYLHRELTKQDKFLVHGKEFRVNNAMDDGYGMLTVALLEPISDEVAGSYDGL